MKKEGKEKLEGARKKLEKQLQQLVRATAELLKPLKSLKEEQIAAIVTLGYLVQGIMQVKSSVAKLGDAMVVRFEKALAAVSPGLAHAVRHTDIFAGCFAQDLEYATAMAKCEKDERDEDECWEAWGAGAVMCRMEKLNELGKYVEDILGGLKPPKPSPWPEILLSKVQ